MAEVRRVTARWLLAVAALLLAAGDGLSLSQELAAHGRERERLQAQAREPFAAALPQLARAAREASPAAVCAQVVALGLGAEAEMSTPAGERLAAYPAPIPLSHRPAAAALDAAPGGVLTVGPLGQPPRLLVYAVVETPGGVALLRASRLVDERSLADRRLSLAAHGLVLLLALVGLALVAAPPSRAGDAAGGALAAYEAAMDRLKSRDEARERLHAEERRRIEGELAELEAMARAGELTAGMVHEVRNALGTIVGHARLLELDASPAAAREAGAGIRAECEAVEAVVRRFMDYVREERLEWTTFDVGALLRRVVTREGRARTPEIEFDLEPGLEACGDEALLERAFENLVRNALEAASSRVRIGGRRSADGWVAWIEDDGPGLALDPAEALRPFRSARPGGLGLGLPTAAKLVRLHGGRIDLGRRAAWTRVDVVLPDRPTDVTDGTERSPARAATVVRDEPLSD